MNDVTPAQYMGDGPVLPSESGHQALGANTVYSLVGHMIKSPAPGHGFEDEPLDAADKASQQTAQNVARSASRELQNGQQDGGTVAAPSFEDSVSHVRSALRPGA